jgi:hypothetical protein
MFNPLSEAADRSLFGPAYLMESRFVMRLNALLRSVVLIGIVATTVLVTNLRWAAFAAPMTEASVVQPAVNTVGLQAVSAVPAQAYRQVVLADSPRAYYRLGEESGTVAVDASGHAVDGRYDASSTLGRAGAVTGDSDTAVASDGTALLTAPASSFASGSTERTVEFWYRSGTSGDYGAPVMTYQNGFSLFLRDGNALVQGPNDNFRAEFGLPAAMNDNAWHLWDVSYDGSNTMVSLDGQPLGTAALRVDTAATGSLSFGARVGNYDELAIYATALSTERIIAHWTRGQSSTAACVASPTTPYGDAVLQDKPAVYYRLGDRKDSRVTFDSSGACLNGAFASYATTSATSAVAGDADGAVASATGEPVVSAPVASLPSAAAARTVEFWYRSGASGDYGRPVMTYGTGMSLFLRDGNAMVQGPNDNYRAEFALPAVMNDNTWHLWDVSYDGANTTVFLDGQSLGTAALKVDSSSAGSLQLGARVGDYDELAVFPAALTPARVTAHWTRGGSSAAACAAAPTSAYGNAVLQDKPALYYRLAERKDSRVAYDSSGNCLNAALASYSVPAVGAIAGDNTGAVSSPDGRPVVRAPAATLPAGAERRTVEFWYKTSSSGDYGAPIMTYGSGFSLFLRDGNAMVQGPNDNYRAEFGLPAAMNDDTWHLWDVNYDGTTTAVFFDGQSLGTAALTVNSGATGALTLGSRVGDYDELAVYPTNLSTGRINAHWTRGGSAAAACAAAPASGYGAAAMVDNPALYYRLGDQQADRKSRVAFDVSGHCLNAALAPYTAPLTTGALVGDTDGAVTAPDGRPILRAPAATLPSEAAPRTVEFWYRSSASGDYGTPVMTYGNSFTLFLRDGNALVQGPNDNYRTEFGLPSAQNDNVWHLWDVSYDGTNASVFMDGQLLGTAGLRVQSVTTGSLTFGTRIGDYDELAVYPAALAADRVQAHFTEGVVGKNAAITGTVSFKDSPVAGAVVEACDTARNCARRNTGTSGTYVLSVMPGSYDITVFPPARGNGSTSRATTARAEVPELSSRVRADVTLQEAVLPAGSSIDSPTIGTQTNGSPTIYWAEPTTYRTTGCPNGLGSLSVIMPNGAERSFVMAESPAGSGKYSVVIPALAPLHGDARVGTSILCRISATPFIPGGGPATGGNTVLVHLDSSSPVASFVFGSVSAPAFKVNAPGLYSVTAPSGTGDVDVSVTFGDRTSRKLDTYHYLSATTISNTGPANGGDRITLTGNGFTPQTVVLFGTRPAAAVTVENPQRLTVTVPSGSGSAPITVIAGGGAVSAGTQTYQGEETKVSESGSGPCPIQEDPTACTYVGLLLQLSADIEGVSPLAAGHYAPSTRLKLGSTDSLSDLAATMIPFILDLTPEQAKVLELGGQIGTIGGVLGIVAAPEVLLVTTIVALGMWDWNHRGDFVVGLKTIFHLRIDPSGSIVDVNGTPVSGATVTLLRQGDDGQYAPVPADSWMIDPNENPQTTGESGAFAWMAAAGSYRVRATSSTCIDPTTGLGAVAEGGPYVLPPPALGLLIKLPCSAGTPKDPEVKGISPGVLPAEGGIVTIGGSNLSGVTSVSFGDRPATSFTVLSPYSLQAVSPAGAGSAHITLRSPAGVSSSSDADLIGYLTAPDSLKTTSLSITTAPNAPSYGDDVIVTVTARGPAGTSGDPTGTLTFREGMTVLGTAVLTAGGAELTVPRPGAGSHTITVDYAGQGGFSPATSDVTFQVAPGATRTSVTAAPNPAPVGAAVTFTATTTATTTTSGAPAGIVTFTDGATTLGTGTLSSSSLTPGVHTVTATFGASVNYAPSNGSTTVTVTPTDSEPVFTAKNPLTAAKVGSVYAYTFVATGQPAPKFAVAGGALPPGLALSTTGSLTGTPSKDGAYSYSVSATNSSGSAVAGPFILTVTAATPTLDKSVSADIAPGTVITSPTLTTKAAGELLIAFVEADGPDTKEQTIKKVTGGGLTWTLASRANGNGGTAEIWQAYAAQTFSAKVNAVAQFGDYGASITVSAFAGAARTVGATASASGVTNHPQVELTTLAAGSLVWGAAHDWSKAASRTVDAGQTLVHQYVYKKVHDTYWVQRLQDPLARTGKVTLAASAPAKDRWQFAAVEIRS